MIRTVVILIGFQYQIKKKNTSGIRKKLPGTLIDLYQVYNFCADIDFNRLEVITDIEQDHNWRETVSAIGKNLVNSDILTFIERLRQDSIYHRHRNKDWLIEKLIEFCRDADRLFIYYTGHGKEGFLELPLEISNYAASGIEAGLTVIENEIQTTTSTSRDRYYLGMDDLRKSCLSESNPYAEVIFILDCCNSTGLNFPFILGKDGVFRLTQKVPQDCLMFYKCQRIKKFKKKHQFFKARGICISSTSLREDSISTTNGSLFTQHLFSCLTQGIASLIMIRDYILINCPQITIHATYPNLHFLWGWIYGREKTFRTKIDPENGLITLEPINDIYYPKDGH